MKQFPSALRAALKGPVTTLAECWRITREDGVVLGFSDHDADLEFDGTRFEARTGLTASEAESELGLASETREVAGALSSARIEEADIAAGRYDGARVETFLVDWTDPVAAHARTEVLSIGEIKRGDLAFTVELRSRMADLDRVRGRLYRRQCDASLGDHRCGIDLEDAGLKRSGTVTGLGERSVTVALSAAMPLDRYRHGHLLFQSGPALGLKAEIAYGEEAGSGEVLFALTQPLQTLPVVGDAVEVAEGCDKRFATCRDRFANAESFRGFPHLPGGDAALGVAKEVGGHDGRPLVP
ncbi:hypothetical protein FP2506_11232 [Fulvimarina pelagi HTCC2506]|uniref:Bacteriophage phiJL001 Gp84 C-terminal domain-containing protein n=1 Tax=Fulvimarina pelagi HTCC2506 TaxID=314231 RepID=Q0FZ33_9HYPH|nr:DUF2163 domain-containing protein [Fulvimarina pelagi]EAU40125.1 hypothetical protein FP2506_11232 [Fulvimarina pelagi HTCC2506]